MNEKQDINKIIKDRFEKLPKEVKDAVTDTQLIQKTKDISTKYSLHVDQLGMLQNEIILVMLGIVPSSTFVETISNDLKIDVAQANLIAKDINETIFNPIRKHLQEWEEGEEEKSSNKNVSDLERLGGFSVEKDVAETPKQGFGTQAMNEGQQGIVDSKDALVASIETPIPAKPSTPALQPIKAEKPEMDAMIDHLLGNPVVTMEQKVERVETTTPVAPQPPQKKLPDSYREPIE